MGLGGCVRGLIILEKRFTLVRHKTYNGPPWQRLIMKINILLIKLNNFSQVQTLLNVLPFVIPEFMRKIFFNLEEKRSPLSVSLTSSLPLIFLWTDRRELISLDKIAKLMRAHRSEELRSHPKMSKAWTCVDLRHNSPSLPLVHRFHRIIFTHFHLLLEAYQPVRIFPYKFPRKLKFKITSKRESFFSLNLFLLICRSEQG